MNTMSHSRAFPLNQHLIVVSGQDQLSYLHGQLTQDLNLINEQQFLWAGHCSPKGKLWGAFKLFKHQTQFYLLGSPAECEASARELKKYGVFANVDINLIDNAALFGILTSDLNATCEVLGVSFLDEQNCCEFEQGIALKLDNERLVVLLNDGAELPQEIKLESDAVVFEEAAILAGEPSLNSDYIEEFVPQMINLQALDGISFKKGCYTGQETVARMRYLGKNKRAMYIVQGNAEQATQESDLEIQLEDNWRRAGKVVSQVFNRETNKYSALAVLPNDTQLDATLRLKHSPEQLVSIQPLPYSLEDQ
jgi:folate-binding protein YgfZ